MFTYSPATSLNSPGGFIASDVFAQLDSGVGRNRPNRREDTMVVQFFLVALRPKWGGVEVVKHHGSVGRNTTNAAGVPEIRQQQVQRAAGHR